MRISFSKVLPNQILFFLKKSLEKLAPNHHFYKNLVFMLQKIRQMSSEEEWKEPIRLKSRLSFGMKDPSISRIRKRLNSLGYKAPLNQNEFDDIEEALRSGVKTQEYDDFFDENFLFLSLFSNLYIIATFLCCF